MVWNFISLGAALFAVVGNSISAYKLRQNGINTWMIRAYFATFASIYVVAYLVLIAVPDIDRGVWSQFLQPLAATVFVTVWIADGWVDCKTMKRTLRARADINSMMTEEMSD